MDNVTEFVPPPTGARFMRSNAPVRLIKGPVGSGKSTVCVVEIFRRCAEMPRCKDGLRRSRWAVVRNTNQQLKTTTLKTWNQWFPPATAGYWKESDKTFYLEVGDIRAEILFLPLDTPDDAQRLLSLELTGVFFNEAREIHPDLIIAARGRLGRYPSKAMLPPNTPYWYGMILDTNPPSRDSFLYEQFEEVCPEGWEIFHQPGGLEPDAENRENLPPSYYEDMMHGATEDWIDVHVHGQYGRSLTGRPVYEKSFKRAFHVAEQILQPINAPSHTLLIGMDFGRTPAAVLGQRGALARVSILDSLYEENIGLKGFLEKHLKPLLIERFPHCKYLVIGDPAGWAKSQLGEENAFDVLKAAGFQAVRAPTNDIEPRIAAVEGLLSQQVDGKSLITFSAAVTSPGMKHLISAMDGGYKYKRKTDGGYEVSPAKDKFSHCFPGDTLISTPSGSVPIAAVSVGDSVNTPFGPRVVVAAMSRTTSDFVEVTFEDGAVFRCTTDHPIYTATGVVLSDALQYNDILLCEGENECAPQSTPCLNLTASGSTENHRGTTKRITAVTEDCTCTGTCGSSITAPSLTGIMCITSTQTGRIIASKILSAFRHGSMCVCTALCGLRRTLGGSKRDSALHGQQPQSGTDQMQGTNGTGPTASALGSTGTSSRTHAPIAGKRLSDFVARTSEDIAVLRAKEWHGKNPESMTLSDSVLYAEIVSELISTGRLKPARRIAGVRRYQSLTPEVVHDLTVMEAHSFYADGVWVSNCSDALQYLALGVNFDVGAALPPRTVKHVSLAGWV